MSRNHGSPTTKGNKWLRPWPANTKSRNHRLTNYEEEQAVEMTVSKYDEQEPPTYVLREGPSRRVEGWDQQMQRAGATDLRPAERNGPVEMIVSKCAGGKDRLTSYEEEWAVKMTVSKGKKQGAQAYDLQRGNISRRQRSANATSGDHKLTNYEE